MPLWKDTPEFRAALRRSLTTSCGVEGVIVDLSDDDFLTPYTTEECEYFLNKLWDDYDDYL